MKNLIYLLTLLFNAFGFLFSVSFLFLIKSDDTLFMLIIFLSCVIFSVGFCITLTDFSHYAGNCRLKRYLMNNADTNHCAIVYRDYWETVKSDFIIK